MAEPTKQSVNNRVLLEQVERAGCYHCTSIFDPSRIRDWIDSGTTALCPLCGIDSVLADTLDEPITKDLLETHRKAYFS